MRQEHESALPAEKLDFCDSLLSNAQGVGSGIGAVGSRIGDDQPASVCGSDGRFNAELSSENGVPPWALAIGVSTAGNQAQRSMAMRIVRNEGLSI
jgi:hypothetical protein